MRIIENLAFAIHDCIQNAQIAILQFSYGPKLCVGNSIIEDNNSFFEVLWQFKTFYEVFIYKII